MQIFSPRGRNHIDVASVRRARSFVFDRLFSRANQSTPMLAPIPEPMLKMYSSEHRKTHDSSRTDIPSTSGARYPSREAFLSYVAHHPEALSSPEFVAKHAAISGLCSVVVSAWALLYYSFLRACARPGSSLSPHTHARCATQAVNTRMCVGCPACLYGEYEFSDDGLSATSMSPPTSPAVAKAMPRGPVDFSPMSTPTAIPTPLSTPLSTPKRSSTTSRGYWPEEESAQPPSPPALEVATSSAISSDESDSGYLSDAIMSILLSDPDDRYTSKPDIWSSFSSTSDVDADW